MDYIVNYASMEKPYSFIYNIAKKEGFLSIFTPRGLRKVFVKSIGGSVIAEDFDLTEYEKILKDKYFKRLNKERKDPVLSRINEIRTDDAFGTAAQRRKYPTIRNLIIHETRSTIRPDL